MAGLCLVVALLATCGFVAGLRPSRKHAPTRLIRVLGLFSLPWVLAVSTLLSDGWMTSLRRRFDPDGFALAIGLALVTAGGFVILVPAWGYAMGRIVNWARCVERRRGDSPARELRSARRT